MQAKHTPGSWEFWHGLVATDIDNDGAVIIAERPTRSGGKRQRQVDADMRLMAASPELLGALQEAYMALIGYLPTHRNSITDAAIEKARAAIAKATGSPA